MEKDKIKIYIIARISEDAHYWTDKVCDQLDDTFEIFKPKDNNPWSKKHETFTQNVFDVDLEAIKNSHMGLMIPEYGKDCAWECGWYANSNKPVIVFIDNQMEWLRDWMVKGGLDYIVTNNPFTSRAIKKDPILKHKKIILIKNIKALNKVMKRIYKSIC